MRYFRFGAFILAVCLLGCNHKSDNQESHKDSTVKVTSIDTTKTSITATSANDKQEIQGLIRKVLNWHSIDLLPAIFDIKDSTCTGFDMVRLKENLAKLKASNLFSATFIENYNQIILALDKKLKNKEFEKWQAGDLPTFAFANDVDHGRFARMFRMTNLTHWTMLR